MAVVPRSMPTGQIFERLGGMIGSSARSGKTGIANANNETQCRIFIFTWHLPQGESLLARNLLFFFSRGRLARPKDHPLPCRHFVILYVVQAQRPVKAARRQPFAIGAGG